MNHQNHSTIETRERKVFTLHKYMNFVIKLVALFVCLVPSSTAFGYAYYSDEWMDDSDANNIRIVGCGITYDSTNGYMGTPHGYAQIHSYWVAVTLTSPSSRTVTQTSYQSNSYATTEISLPIIDGDGYDLGDYTVGTQHWQCCDYMTINPMTGTRCYANASSSISIYAGASLTVMVRTADPTLYVSIANCNVHCRLNTLVDLSMAHGQYVVFTRPWVYYSGAYHCTSVGFVVNTTSGTQCADVSGFIPIPYP